MMPWLGQKGASLQWEAKASPAGEGTFCSGVEGESATTAFQLPRGPFHLRMLGRTGWFSSAQNCKDSTGGRALPPGAAAGEPRGAGNRRIALFGDASGCIRWSPRRPSPSTTNQKTPCPPVTRANATWELAAHSKQFFVAF